MEAHANAVSLHFMYYKFVRIHASLRITPAMASGVTGKLRKIANIMTLIEAKEAEKSPARSLQEQGSNRGAMNDLFKSPLQRRNIINYLLLIASPFGTAPALVALYLSWRAAAAADDDWRKSHYLYQKQSALVAVLARLAVFPGLPLFIMSAQQHGRSSREFSPVIYGLAALLTVWLVARVIRGMLIASRHQAIANPRTFGVWPRISN
ncbi:MAG: hypothetical protein EOS03_30480 [Mesorhizobium sp.]|nr:MAG: hypothetical protein EOS03_30480 [Mesorhizobium sp.]